MINFLVATDFSKHSDMALETSKFLTQDMNARCEVFHLDEVTTKLKKFKDLPNVSELHKEFLNFTVPSHLVSDIEDQLKRVNYPMDKLKLKVLESDSFKAVIDYANEHKDDCVVVTVSDEDALSKLLFGSFADKTLFKIPNNVLLLKSSLKHPIKKIGVCFDPSQDSESVLDEAIKYAKFFNASVDLIYIEAFDSREIYKNVFLTEGNPEKEKNNYIAYQKKLATKTFEKYQEKISKAGVNCNIDLEVTVDRAPSHDLIKHLKENPVDLIMVEPSQGFLQNFKFQSTSYDLIKHVPSNFLIIKEQKEG